MEDIKFVADVIYFVIVGIGLLVEAYYVFKYARGVFTNEDYAKLDYYNTAIKYNGVTLTLALTYGIFMFVVYPIL